MTKPASCTHPASGRSTSASAGNPHFNLQRPRGLLEPCAAMSGTHGSEGAPALQRAGATRLGLTADDADLGDDRARLGKRYQAGKGRLAGGVEGASAPRLVWPLRTRGLTLTLRQGCSMVSMNESSRPRAVVEPVFFPATSA